MRPTALITGASSGIGYELARWFAKAGYDLILVARSEAKLHALKNELPGNSGHVIVQDLAYPGAAEELFHKVRELDLKVDVLVNNAGFGLGGDFDTITLDSHQKMLHLNAVALTELSYLFLDDMKQSKFSKTFIPRGILNVSSLAAYLPGPGMAVYHASKAYVLSLSEALREELSGTGIQVTTLCPGPTETNFFKAAQVESWWITRSSQSADHVARIGFLGFLNGKSVVFPGFFSRTNAVVAQVVPHSFTSKATRSFYNLGSRTKK